MHTDMQDTSTLPDPGAALLRCLGETVRGLRREAGLSRVELAARSGVSARFLAQLESGGNVSVGTLAQIAGALQLPPWALLREASERQFAAKKAERFVGNLEAALAMS